MSPKKSQSRLHPVKPANPPRVLWFGWLYMIFLVLALYGTYEFSLKFGSKGAIAVTLSRDMFRNPQDYDAWIGRWQEAEDQGLVYTEEPPTFDLPMSTPLAIESLLQSGLLSWLVVGTCLLLLLFTRSGWVSLAEIQKRKQGRRGLAMALVMAWLCPAILIAFGPAWILMERFRYNYDYAMVSINSLFIVVGIAFFVWIRYQYRRISAEIMGKAGASSIESIDTSASGQVAARQAPPPKVLWLGCVILFLLCLSFMHGCETVVDAPWISPWLPVGDLVLATLFTVAGWFAVGRIRRRRQGTRGLTVALLMAWGFPMLLFVTVPPYIYLFHFGPQNELTASVTTLVGVVLLILCFMWFTHLHRRHSAESRVRAKSRNLGS